MAQDTTNESVVLAGRVCSLCGAAARLIAWIEGRAVVGACAGPHLTELRRLRARPLIFSTARVA